MALTDNMKGAVLMTLSMAGFTLNDACMKALAGDLPLAQAVVLRGVQASVLIYLLGRGLGALRFDLPAREWKLIGLRAVAEVGATYTFLSALFNMPIANVTAILQALPLTVAMAAWLFLGEPLGWRRLLAIGVGFIGVLLIIQPGGTGFSSWSIYALGTVGFVTFRDIIVRRMAKTTPSMTVAFINAVAITLVFGVMSLAEDWAPVDARAAGILMLAAVFIFGGYLFSVMVMRVGEIGFVAPFRYTGMIAALIVGYLLFGDWPDVLTLLGAAIVVAMGLFTLYRERVLTRRG